MLYTTAWRWVFSSRSLAHARSPLAAWLRQVPSALFAWIFPDTCRVCGDELTGYSRAPICKKCLESPKPLIPEIFCAKCRTPFLRERALDENRLCRLCAAGASAFDSAYSWGSYDGVLKDLIHFFKFQGMRSLGRRLGAWMVEAMPCSERLDAIVPMPIHWTRRMTRGFNQCETLADELSRHTGLPVLKALARTRRTPKQSSLAGARRRRNVKGSFSAAHAHVRGKRLLLVDDVMTTGSTVNEAAAELKRHGAARVAVLTVARVDRRGFLSLQTDYKLTHRTEETTQA